MKRTLLLFYILMLQLPAWAQTFGRISGKILDSDGRPLAGATIHIQKIGASTLSDENGLFSFAQCPPGPAILKASFVGYSEVDQSIQIQENKATEVVLIVSIRPFLLDDVVVTASKRPEKITQAPSSIHVITSREIAQIASYNPAELYARVQGLEFVRSGVNVITINARGFNNAYNAKILQMTDGRNSMLAGSSGLASAMMSTVIKEDIDRIEIALGPNSALYGPNAHNGVLNTLTKDPRKYQGTTVALSGGNQEVFSGRFRHASTLNDKWAFKLTGEYTTGKDFPFKDSVYAGGGVYGPAITIPEKISTYQFRHMRGEAHIYHTISATSFAAVSYGGSTNNYINVSNLTRNQGQNWAFSFLQARYVSSRLFVQAYETWTNAGDTYGISGYTRDFWNRTHSTITDPANPLYSSMGRLSPDSAETYALRLGNRFKEMSKRFNSEVQYNETFDRIGLTLVAGVTYQKDTPKTFGTILADAQQPVEITQYGGALQLEKTLPWEFKLVGAARLDHHSLFGNLFSPKVGLVKGVPGGTVRLTWGRAFAAPIILFQRANVFGFIFGNGNGVSFVPNGASINDAAIIAKTTPMQPEQINTWEAGYKGHISKKLYFDISGYYGQSKNFLSPAISVGGRPLQIGDIPIPVSTLLAPGTVNNTGILTGASFSSYFNYGEVTSYGVDLGINFLPTPNTSFGLKYSWFGSDITKDNLKNDANQDGYISLEERSLNAPKNRITGIISFQNLLSGKLFVTLSGRWVQQYDMYSGSQIGTKAGQGKRGVVYGGINALTDQPRYYLKNFDWGPVGGFVTVDISAGINVSSMMSLTGSISNLLNTRQIEFIASPSIGRLASLELKVMLPGTSR